MEMEDHLQLFVTRDRICRVLRDWSIAWRLADADSYQDESSRQGHLNLSRKTVIMAQHLLVHLLHESVHLVAVAALASKALIWSVRVGHWSIGQSFRFGDKVYIHFVNKAFDLSLGQTHHIHTKPVDTFLEPPMHHIVYLFSQLFVLPVEVRLLSQIILLRGWVPFPSRVPVS